MDTFGYCALPFDTLALLRRLAGCVLCAGLSGLSGLAAAEPRPGDPASGRGQATARDTSGRVVGGVAEGFSGRLRLALNGTDVVELGRPGAFAFARRLPPGTRYQVTVATQPTGQFCEVRDGRGIALGDVRDIRVRCRPGRMRSLHALGAVGDGAGLSSAFLEASDGKLYGVVSHGGWRNLGVVMRITPGGRQTVLAAFGADVDLARPLQLAQGPDLGLYGVTRAGGAYGSGMIFRMDLDGRGFEVLYHFGNGEDGAHPGSALLRGRDGRFLGVTTTGGSGGGGTVYRYCAHRGLQVLHAFEQGGAALHSPATELVEDELGLLYGVAAAGGAGGSGGVFVLDPEGAGCVDLLSIPAGWALQGLMRASDGSLHAVMSAEGRAGRLLRIAPDGTATMRDFPGDAGAPREPRGTLVEGHDGRLYGVSLRGGDHDLGSIYSVEPASGRMALHHSFGEAVDTLGMLPQSSLLLSSQGLLYGSTRHGGPYAAGVVFTID